MLRPFILLSLMATAFAAKKTFLAKAPESEKGPPSLKCIPRKERPFADIKDGGLKGSYPKAAISKAKKSDKSFKSGFSAARIDLCGCYRRPRPPIDLAGVAGPKGPDGPSSPPSPPSPIPFGFFKDTCPAVRSVFTFPRSQFYLGERCWVLRPWAGLSCPYRRCINPWTKCDGVRPSIFPYVTQCRHTNIKYRFYYIWCPRKQRVYRRYVRLPQCCSCMYLRCLGGPIG